MLTAGRNLSLQERSLILLRFADLIEKHNDEIALRKAVESKFAQAEAELVHIKTRQAEMEETYLTAHETQECQPAIREKDTSSTLPESHPKECLLQKLPSSVEIEEEPRTDTTSDEITPEGYPRECQMVQSHKKSRYSEE